MGRWIERPLLGSLARPLGGWLADRAGGARVTLATFAAMVPAVLGVVLFLGRRAGNPAPSPASWRRSWSCG